MSVIGVDPGSGGALALYDAKNDALDITDMPTATVTIGKSRRMRIDAVSLLEYFEVAKLMGAELVIIEAVGGRPGQSGMNAFTFGYGVGLIYMRPSRRAYRLRACRLVRGSGYSRCRAKRTARPVTLCYAPTKCSQTTGRCGAA